MQRIEQNVPRPTDAFKPHFATPSLPSNIVLDFESVEDDNRVSTQESNLRAQILYIALSVRSTPSSCTEPLQ